MDGVPAPRADARRRPRVGRGGLRRLDRGRARGGRVRARDDGRRPGRARPRSPHALGRHRAARGAARRLLDARHGRDLRARRRAAGRARRRRLDLQRLGRAEVVDLGEGPRDRPLRHGGRGRRARVVDARERGRRDPRRRRGHRARHRDRAARPGPQPVRRQGARRGRARPHHRGHQGDLAAARAHPRLRGLRHARPCRHGRHDPLARHAARCTSSRIPSIPTTR